MTCPSHRHLLSACAVALFCGFVEVQAQDEPQAAPAAPQSVLPQEPQTPQEIFQAVMLMMRLDRPDLAQVYLQQFLETQPDDATLLQLRDQYGTGAFYQLTRVPALQPQADQLLGSVEAASVNKINDPAYFDSLIDHLQGTPREQEAALMTIRQLGADAVPELLQRLGEGARINQHDLLLHTLTRIGPQAVPPLLAALDSPSERIRALALEALGWLGDEEIVPYLWYSAFGSDQPLVVQQAARRAIARIRYDDADRTDKVAFHGVVDEVRDLALEHFAGDYKWVPNDEGELEVWSYEPQQNQIVKTMATPSRASAFQAQRLAHEALLMAPDRRDLQALFLAASLAESGFRSGWNQPWPVGPGTAHNLALFSGADLTNQALQLALDEQNAAAAIGALKALGETATPNALSDGPRREAPIVAALDYPNDRVQFAAATCILQIDPAGHFPPAYRVVEILARALSDNGRPASVVIDPNKQRAAGVAAVLNALGYESDVATTGREGFQTAADRGDVTLAVLHPNTIRWDLTQTVANFRADARTAGIPLAFYGPQPVEHQLCWLLDQTEHSKFIVTGGDSGDWRRQLASLVNSVAVPPLTHEQRAQQIAAAAYWLRHIADGARTQTYDLVPAEAALTEAVQNPDVAADALAALAAIPRVSVQKRLAELITAPAQMLEIRVQAAWQLAQHIRRFGRLLTQADVDELQATWQNADEPQIRTALTAVLGILGISESGVISAMQRHELSTSP